MVFSTEQEAIKEVKFCNSAKHSLTQKEYEQGRVSCEKCKNRGFTYVHTFGAFGWYVATKDCDCVKVASQKTNLNNSGLSSLVAQFTFENFRTNKGHWQVEMKEKARHFLNVVEFGGKGWLLALGQSGAGKTHICTALCSELINKGFTVKYFRWGVDCKRIKAIANKPEYAAAVDEIISHDVIYIDDLFKRKKGADVADADVKLAFELIDTAYAERKILIVSGEDFIEDLYLIDEATGGRLVQNATPHIIEIEGQERNQRL